MSGTNEDDKATVVLDLNALKNHKLKKTDDLTVNHDLEFNVSTDEEMVEDGEALKRANFPVILFDLQSDFFKQSQAQFPKGFNYKVISDLSELNKILRDKNFQVIVFNYDVNSKAINQLCAQIKQKFPTTKTMIMAKSISAEKAKMHAATPSGASGYYQFPLEASKIERELLKIYSADKKAS